MQPCPWISRTWEQKDTPLDDLMTFQGSCWFMSCRHWNWLGELDPIGYGPSCSEQHEISLKTWLGGGRVVINKNTWYTHLPLGREPRGFHWDTAQMNASHLYTANYWTGDQWSDRIHDFDWLIEKFWPLPLENTRVPGEKYYWPQDWRGLMGTKI